MKSLKLTSRKKFGAAQDARRSPKGARSTPVPSKERLSARNGRRGKAVLEVLGKPSRGLDRARRRSTVTGNGDGQLLAAVKHFEAAVLYFQKESYGKAKEILKRLADTAPPEVADRARVHLRLCEQRSATASAPKTAADNYLFGVAELNAGRQESAADYLEKAHQQEPKREDVCYALAACYALQGKADAALEFLKVAVDLRPQNRFQARQDADFESLAGNPRFRELVGLASFAVARAAP
jgi:tetratricopeptide (TPR) repeat protein